MNMFGLTSVGFFLSIVIVIELWKVWRDDVTKYKQTIKLHLKISGICVPYSYSGDVFTVNIIDLKKQPWNPSIMLIWSFAFCAL